MAEPEPIDIELVKQLFSMLGTDEHQGDVADTMIYFAPKFGLPEPTWDDDMCRYYFPWDKREDDDG